MIVRGVVVLALLISGLVAPPAPAAPRLASVSTAAIAPTGAGVANSVATATKPRATLAGSYVVKASGKVRVSVTSNAKKVKLTYRTAKNKKRTATIKIRKGEGAKTLRKGSKKIYAQAGATKKLRKSRKVRVRLAVPPVATPPVVTPPVVTPPPVVVPPVAPPPVVDVAAPGPVLGLAVTDVTDSSVSLAWTNPVDTDLAGVIVRRAMGATAPASPTSGVEVLLSGPVATSVTDVGLAANAVYSYAVFTRDAAGNSSGGVVVSATTLPGVAGVELWVDPGEAVTVSADGGYSLAIPAGALRERALVTVRPLPALHGLIPRAEFHIAGDWSGSVETTLPVPSGAQGFTSVVLHDAADGPRITSGGFVHSDTVGGQPVIRVSLTSLSEVDLLTLPDPCDQHGLFVHELACRDRSDEPLANVLVGDGQRAGQEVLVTDVGHTDCPAADGKLWSAGDIPRRVSCTAAVDGDSGTWSLSNVADPHFWGTTESGIVYSMEVKGTFERTITQPAGLSPISKLFFAGLQTGYLVPGGTANIAKLPEQGASRVDLSPDPGATPLWATLGFVAGVIGDDLWGTGHEATNLRVSTEVTTCLTGGLSKAAVTCATSAVLAAATSDEYIAWFTAQGGNTAKTGKTLVSASRALSLVDLAMVGDSFLHVLREMADTGTWNKLYIQMLPGAPIDPPTPRGEDAYIARDPATGYSLLVTNGQANPINDDATFLCLARSLLVWEIPTLKALIEPGFPRSDTPASCAPGWAVTAWTYTPTSQGGNTGTNVLMRNPNGDSWLVSPDGKLQPADPNTYLCLARTRPVIWSTPTDKTQAWTPRSAVAATCGASDPLPKFEPTAFSKGLSDTSDEGWKVVSPAANGWWLLGHPAYPDNGENPLEYLYKWVGPDGRDGPSWTSPYYPGWVAPRSPAVPGSNGEIFLVAYRPGDYHMALFRVGANSIGATLDVGYNPGNPWGFNLAMGRDGSLYWQTNLASGESWILQIDPDTLAITGRIGAGGEALQATKDGIAAMTTSGSSTIIPYEAFTSQDGQTWAAWREAPLQDVGDFRRMSLGYDGALAVVTYESRPGYSCDYYETAYQPADGIGWRKNLGDLVGLPLTNCLAVDIDARPAGGVVYTLKSDEGTYLLEVSAGGERESWTRLDDAGANISTMIDDSGLVVTSYTRPLQCPGDPPTDECSEVALIARRSGAEVFREAWAGPEQATKPYLWLVGTTEMQLGDSQIGMFIVSAASNSCGSLDNCSPQGSLSFRTKLLDVLIPTKPANAWW